MGSTINMKHLLPQVFLQKSFHNTEDQNLKKSQSNFIDFGRCVLPVEYMGWIKFFSQPLCSQKIQSKCAKKTFKPETASHFLQKKSL